MKTIKTEDAIGSILCHDITRIIPNIVKDAVFRKGHIITKEDIPILLSVGKEHVYVWEQEEGMLHENEAARILFELCKDTNMKSTEVKEGKIELIAEIDGLFQVDIQRLNEINEIDDIMIATISNDIPVKKGDKLGGTRVIPLVIEKEKLDLAKSICGISPLLSIIPFHTKKVGIVTTGSEVKKGLIQDGFTPVLLKKLGEYPTKPLGQILAGDEKEAITGAILEWIELGAELILCTGGMSVDPDDRTPQAIKETGAHIVSYGAPVLPGAMFLLAYYNGIPICGLPGCIMYAKRTIFDIILPRLMTNQIITKKEINQFGCGGFCRSCKTCTYPNCGFGK